MMEKLFLLLLFCHISSPEKHLLKLFLTASYGVPNVPDLMATLVVDDILASSCDTNKKIVEAKQDWVKELFRNDPEHLKWLTGECVENQPNFFKILFYSLAQIFNQSGGVHIIQEISGCEWDDETGEVNGFIHHGYDGEDLVSFDVKTLTWIALTPQADTTKQRWDADEARIQHNKNYLTELCPDWLKKCWAFRKIFPPRTDLPSVSLLQKSPYSPFSCHATGFYPHRAMMFWRRDGEELHEDVDLGEILPNNDGTFQMSVDLNLSSVAPEDWRRYDCVFQLSGVKDAIVTRLDEAVIKTNWEEPSNITPTTVAVVVVFAVVLIAVVGFTVCKKRTAPVNSSELSERLNPEM